MKLFKDNVPLNLYLSAASFYRYRDDKGMHLEVSIQLVTVQKKAPIEYLERFVYLPRLINPITQVTEAVY